MPEIITDIEQGSEEWLKLRIGSIGGTAINSVLAGGSGKMRRALLYQLTAEILTGIPHNCYEDPDTGELVQLDRRWQFDRGHFYEDDVLNRYRLYYEDEHKIFTVTMVRGDMYRTHYSPDALIGEDSILEIKVRVPHVFIETRETDKLDTAVRRQIQHGLWVCDREFVDLVDYCPELPADKNLWVRTFPRDENLIDEIEEKTGEFLKELDEMVGRYS